MKLHDFFQANGNVTDYTELSLHTSLESFSNPPVAPLDIESYYHYSSWRVIFFCVDDNGNWHVWVTPPTT